MSRKCLICGGEIPIVKNENAKYCSEKCAREARNRNALKWHKRHHNDFEKVCPTCGKSFTTSDNRISCCSRSCAARFRQARKKKENAVTLSTKASDDLPTKPTVTEKNHYGVHIRAVRDELGKRYRVDSWLNEGNPKKQLRELMTQFLRWSLNKSYFSDQELIDILTEAYNQSMKDYAD